MKRLEWVLVMSVALMGCEGLGAEASAGESAQGRGSVASDRLASLERELAQARSELATRDTELAALKATVSRLEQTPQGLFDKASEALKAERWGEASERFGELVTRFPSDAMVEAARKNQARAQDGELAAYVEGVDAALDLGDKNSFARAATELAARIEACSGCKSRRRARSKLAAILRQWPIEVANIKTLLVRYGCTATAAVATRTASACLRGQPQGRCCPSSSSSDTR